MCRQSLGLKVLLFWPRARFVVSALCRAQHIKRPEAIPVIRPEENALPLLLLAAIDPISAAHCFKIFLLIAETDMPFQ